MIHPPGDIGFARNADGIALILIAESAKQVIKLVIHLGNPGLDGHAMFAAVKRPVALESDQTPQYSDIRRSGHDGGDFLLVRRAVTTRGIAVAPRTGASTEQASPPQSSSPAASQAAEIAFRNSIKESSDPRDFRAYLQQFPSGVFAGLANNRLKSSAAEQKTAGVIAPAKPATASAVQPAVGVFPKLKPGDAFKDCDACPEMVVIPKGKFMMGSPPDEEDVLHIERPVHQVLVPSFAMGKFEVTRDEFAAFVKQTGHDATGACLVRRSESGWTADSSKSWRDPDFEQSGLDPVVCMNREDAKSYVVWLSRKTGHTYRLPSESEWEYAARAGTTTPYNFGDNADEFNFNESYVYRTDRVGRYSSNAFGLHDVHGNAIEWVEDCWNDSYAGAPSDGSAWETGDCGHGIIRGGAWYFSPRNVRSAHRYESGLDGRSNFTGFRVARTLGQ